MPYDAAAQMEQDLAEDLRQAGYTVTGGHSPGTTNRASSPKNLYSPGSTDTATKGEGARFGSWRRVLAWCP
jgi:hypothetical protein